ncbi:MAG: hypothetical protein D6B25_11505 [Desulfobulbaceae bacterium]|nr:MAG: hypothetical protein D6B25_11505 [Desulfobulbaceae bacterium]
MNGVSVSKYGGAELLDYGTLADPSVANNQVLIEMRAASVNFADINARKGDYHLGRSLPFTPGLDLAGVVRETGKEVKNIKPGDHVIAFPASGSYAELAIASQSLTFVIPEQIDFQQAAAAALVGGTVTYMLKYLAQITPEQRLLIHAAAGGVGTAAFQVARALGISQIYGSSSSPWKHPQIQSYGVQAIVDYREPSYPEIIMEVSENKGADVILNPLGGSTVQTDLQCLAPFGRLVLFGELSKESTSLPPAGLYTTNKTIIGASFGHLRKNQPDEAAMVIQDVIEMLADGRLKMSIDRSLPLSEAARAHQLLEDQGAVGKIVLVPDQFLERESEIS